MRLILDKRPIYEQMALYRSGLYIVFFCVCVVGQPARRPFLVFFFATIASIGSSYGPLITPSLPSERATLSHALPFSLLFINFVFIFFFFFF